jgi:ArsR family transcriptional regulator
MEELERTLKTLADKNRLRIVGLLSREKLCVCELASVLKITQPSVSKHLKKLKQAGIIDSEQDGFWTNYFLVGGSKNSERELVIVVEKLLSELLEIKADARTAKKINRQKLCCR